MNTELIALEEQYKEKLFKDSLTLDNLKILAVTISQLLHQGNSHDHVYKVTGLNASQVKYIMSTKEYHHSVHTLVDNDSEITRMLLKPHKLKVVEMLMEKVEEGDMAAIREYFNRCDKEEKTSASFQEVWYEMMKQFGVQTQDEEARELLQSVDNELLIEAEVIESTNEDQGTMTEEQKRIEMLKKELGI